MAIKSSIDGVEVILEGEDLVNFQAQRQKDIEEAARVQAELESQIAARQAVLEKLGLTEDEAKLIIG